VPRRATGAGRLQVTDGTGGTGGTGGTDGTDGTDGTGGTDGLGGLPGFRARPPEVGVAGSRTSELVAVTSSHVP
jgi:hypothetical protein